MKTPVAGSTSMTALAREPAASVPDARAEVRALVQELLSRVDRLLTPPPVAPPAGLVLDARSCRLLDDLLGLGATLSSDQLLAAVGRLGAIRIGDIRIPFTPGQLSELAHRAQKRGRTVEAEMKAVVARIEDELFYKGG